MRILCSQNTTAFEYCAESKIVDKPLFTEEYKKNHYVPEKIISHEVTDSEYLLRKNRLSDFLRF